eukprot:3819676-Pyramimonas_sp.AAC.1
MSQDAGPGAVQALLLARGARGGVLLRGGEVRRVLRRRARALPGPRQVGLGRGLARRRPAAAGAAAAADARPRLRARLRRPPRDGLPGRRLGGRESGRAGPNCGGGEDGAAPRGRRALPDALVVGRPLGLPHKRYSVLEPVGGGGQSVPFG